MDQERAVIWAAVSSEDQADPTLPSLDEQESAGRRHCEQSGDVVVAVLRAEGFSRYWDSLPRMVSECAAYQQLIELIDTGACTKVVCAYYHRLWRTRALQGQVCSLADARDVWLYSTHEPLERNASDTAMWVQGISGIRAEQEVRELVERHRMGLRGRAKAGRVVSSRRPYGYRMEGRGRERTLVPVPEEAAGVRFIFESRAAGLGYGQIGMAAYNAGHHNPNHDDGRWTDHAISYICRNPIYIGQVRLREWPRRPKAPRRGQPTVYIVQGHHEPLISEDLWQRVQRINESQARNYTRHGLRSNPYVGLLRCGYCGDTMVYRYRPNANAENVCCGRYQRQGGPRNEQRPDSCVYNGYPVRKIDAAVLAWLRRALDNPSAWARQFESADQARERARRIADIEREIAGIRLRRTNLLDAIETAGNAADRQEFVRRYDQWGLTLMQREAEIVQLRESGERLARTVARLHELRATVPDPAQLDAEQLRVILRQVVDRIIIKAPDAPLIIPAGLG